MGNQDRHARRSLAAIALLLVGGCRDLTPQARDAGGGTADGAAQSDAAAADRTAADAAPGDAAPADAAPPDRSAPDVHVAACGNGFCDTGESCDGQPAAPGGPDLAACPADCPGVLSGAPAGRYCCVQGVCVGDGCAPATDCQRVP